MCNSHVEYDQRPDVFRCVDCSGGPLALAWWLLGVDV